MIIGEAMPRSLDWALSVLLRRACIRDPMMTGVREGEEIKTGRRFYSMLIVY